MEELPPVGEMNGASTVNEVMEPTGSEQFPPGTKFVSVTTTRLDKQGNEYPFTQIFAHTAADLDHELELAEVLGMDQTYIDSVIARKSALANYETAHPSPE